MPKNRTVLLSLSIVLTITAFANASVQAEEDDQTRIQALSPAAQALVAQGAMHLFGHREQAAADFSKAIQLEPRSALLYKLRGDAYKDCEEWPKALADFDSAIRLDPSYLAAYESRGKLRYEAKQYPSAILDLTKAVDFTSDNKSGPENMTKANLLECYLEQKQYAKVVELSTIALKHVPWASYYCCRAKAYLGLGENRKCVEDCDAGKKLDSGMVLLDEIRTEGMKRLASTHH